MFRHRSLPAPAAVAVALALAMTPGGAASAAATASAQPVALAASARAGVDVAHDAVATASSVELDEDRFAAALANDGDPSTRWSSKYVDDSWLQLALAKPSPVYSVEIDWPNACARAFSLQTSVDGTTWKTVAERTGQTTCPRTDEIVIDSDEPVSFVRMQGAQRWSQYGYSISEMRVWNGPKPEPVPELPLVPQPVEVQRADGAFTLPADARIEASRDAKDAAKVLRDVLRPSTGYRLPITGTRDRVDSAIEIDVADGLAPAGHAAEGYVLDVDADGIRIGADTAAGALNGVQTLRQLLPAWAEGDSRADIDWTVPFVSIEDYPRFEHRGLMVDVARSFYTVDEVKRLIDSAAPLKLNRLHLHLTDDQGWRLAMDTPRRNPSGIDYRLLTKISGATAMTYNGAGDLMGTELGHTGFYTQRDYREIVKYAAANGMTVIPEIDLPGHTNAALHAIPQLNSAGSSPKPEAGSDTAPAQGTGDVGRSTFDANNDATYEFISTVLRQLAELTPGRYIHIGGDEAHTTSHADYVKMVDFANAQVAGLGKTVLGWNEYAGTALPQDDAVVQYWNGAGAPVAAAVADHGAKVIMSPANRTYYPQKQDARQTAGGTWACGGPCTLENAYNWNPATQISGVGEGDVLGVEGAFWGEFIRGVDQAQFFTFPRLLATAETGWTPQTEKNTSEFLQRVADSGPRLALQGVNFFPTATVDWAASAAPRVTVSKGLNSASHSKAKAKANVKLQWRIAAPATSSDEVTARIIWADGHSESVALKAGGTTDIAAMTLNPVYTGQTTRTVSKAGDYTAQFEVSVAGDVVSTTPITVTVPSRH
ncbi:family 20 glycosylhydrolase [Microbacterium sp. KUDC0406]|uniref:family 20 glycosylhydrolase n=1 Tax=Microbacterium sp. KUDC0406 TaxID=2909588 RepID=UPI001F2989B0|nr:family 20 glycosylhydrolase [Microbacterium sp. KUDC0406]UJP09615.1 family 20 glycosylhydrolase [Microbacterium sp. KUDC0406]